jgi:hypothetical protein
VPHTLLTRAWWCLQLGVRSVGGLLGEAELAVALQRHAQAVATVPGYDRRGREREDAETAATGAVRGG